MPINVSILFIGDKSIPEFAPVIDWLAQRNATIESNVNDAMSRLQAGFAPAVIIVTQPWPGHVSSRQIESLRKAAPLARIVGLLGTWLEGEARTGKPWPGVWRTYWCQSLPRFAVQFERFAAGEETAWSLPTTASDDERLLHQSSNDRRSVASTLPATIIAIITPNRETAESLANLCDHRGWQTVWLRSVNDDLSKEIDLAVVDCRNLGTAELAQISDLKSQIGEIPIVVLAGFPRVEDIHRLHAMGIATIISKPFFADELAWQIEQACARKPFAA
jgi:CheY-like chemotaxis protein